MSPSLVVGGARIWKIEVTQVWEGIARSAILGDLEVTYEAGRHPAKRDFLDLETDTERDEKTAAALIETQYVFLFLDLRYQREPHTVHSCVTLLPCYL